MYTLKNSFQQFLYGVKPLKLIFTLEVKSYIIIQQKKYTRDEVIVFKNFLYLFCDCTRCISAKNMGVIGSWVIN